MSRRVLIKTLPLHSNYGGILQAYALQRIVRDLGFRAVTDTSEPLPLQRRLRRLWGFRRRVRMSLPARADWGWRAAREVTASQRAFIARHITSGSFVERAYTRRGRIRLARRFRTFVVGSDQVWRAAYADIPAQFLDVIDSVDGDQPRRISFAASFGLDDIAEYSDRDRVRATELIQRFDAVSVRETSGVHICRDQFGVHAERHVDPTMLLTADHYRGLASRSGAAQSPAAGRMLVYRLDPSDHLQRVERELSERLGVPPLELLPSGPPPSYREYALNPAGYETPSIEHWLACFASADFVVTDSFHGCVFSILFNRPFVVYANARRGASRFDTLLGIFGLEHHVVSSSSGAFDDRVFTPDWTTVNRLLDTERARALSYLEANL
ncbi:polysaccharide pyruvyl transferase family protein [Agromyces bauzanensis]